MLHRGLWETLWRNQSASFCYRRIHVLPTWRFFVLKDSEGIFVDTYPHVSTPERVFLSVGIAQANAAWRTHTGITAWPYPLYSLNKCVTRSWAGMKRCKNPTKLELNESTTHFQAMDFWWNHAFLLMPLFCRQNHVCISMSSKNENCLHHRAWLQNVVWDQAIARHFESLPSWELPFSLSFNHHLHMPELPKAGLQQCLLNRSTTWRHFVSLARDVESPPRSFWPSVEGDLASPPHVELVLHIAMAAHND